MLSLHVTGRTTTVESRRADDRALAGVWRSLQDAQGVGTPFLTWEWFSAFADVPELSRRARVLVVRDGGAPIGLFPVQLGGEPGKLRRLEAAGSGVLDPDHLDVVAVAPRREQVAEAVTEYLRRGTGWDVTEMAGLDGEGALASALTAGTRRTPTALLLRHEIEPVPVVDLVGESAPAVLEMLQRRSRRGMRRAWRSGGGFDLVTDPGRAAPLLDTLIRLHTARFGAASQVFATPALRTFHHLVVPRLMASGLARLGRLVVDEAVAAVEYMLLLDDRAFSYQSGFSPEHGHAPGRTAMCQTILAAAREGRREYDLLRGDEDYKAEYSTRTRCDVRLLVVRPTWRTVHWALGRLTGWDRR
ncbi:GNAT family N-acetyltransferase [Kineosporiaceae bacterium SCSIO 59966]|nr:GNAT family N-acetyltransferase [Kineosporiaceae bacterium SCSIO 59966]